jgi:NADH-quinone oxidoreductase subunit M
MSVVDLLVAIPALTAFAIAVLPLPRYQLTVLAFAATSLTLAVSIGVWLNVIISDRGGFELETHATWIKPLDIGWRIGVDALSAPLVVLTGVLTWCCVIAMFRRAPSCGGERALLALVLLIEAGSIGTFVSLDLIVFFVFFEVVLIPMWFVIADWGDEHDPVGRRRAASRFLVVTVTGSALVLVGFLLLHGETGSFDLVEIIAERGQISYEKQVLIAVLLMLGFGAKVPIWPLHFWLPDAHSKAPTIGSVLLAGVLLKLGTYGLLRFWFSTVPEGALDVAPWLGALGVVGIIYGSLACLAQTDLKRLIAYSSIGHMGFVVLAISTLTPQGAAAANFANVAHGAITGLLFFLVGGLKDRVGGTAYADIGRGLYGRSPHLGAVFGLTALASLGLPGLAGFWGEMLTMLAAYSPNPDLPSTTYVVFMVLAGVGVVLTTAYFIAAIRRVCQGATGDDALPDVDLDEWVAWSPLLAITVGLGFFPMALLWSADAATVMAGAVFG